MATVPASLGKPDGTYHFQMIDVVLCLLKNTDNVQENNGTNGSGYK